MIFKSSSVLNFAHGELLAMGAFLFLVLSSWAKLPIPIAFLLTLAGCFALGFIIERLFLRPLIGEALIQVIMLTVGLAAMFKGLMLFLFGGNLHNYPDFLPETLSLHLGTIKIPPVYTVAVMLAVLFLLLLAFFKYSSLGIYMRSVADSNLRPSPGGSCQGSLPSPGDAALVCQDEECARIINGINVQKLSAIGLGFSRDPGGLRASWCHSGVVQAMNLHVIYLDPLRGGHLCRPCLILLVSPMALRSVESTV
jgi:branched-chain amino acid transport system permease protein